MGDRRTVLMLLINFGVGFLGVIVALLMTGTLQIPSWPSIRSSPQRPVPPRPDVASSPTSKGAQDSPASSQYDVAMQKLQAGRLEEAQEDFLQMLLLSGSYDPRAMQGLIRVRRQLAHNDPAQLREQAATFRRAIAGKGEIRGGYTPAAMELIAEASQRAALELESAQAGASKPPVSQNAPTPRVPSQPAPPSSVRAQPVQLSVPPNADQPDVGIAQAGTTYKVRSGDTLSTIAQHFGVTVQTLREFNQLRSDRLSFGQALRIPSRGQKFPEKTQLQVPPPKGEAPPKENAGAPAPVPAPPKTATTPPGPTAPEPVAAPKPVPAPKPAPAPAPLQPVSFYLVQVGPIASADRAAEIAGELTLGGFAASTSRREEPQLFRVVTGPMLREAAERRATTLGQQGFHPTIQLLSNARAKLDFGTFPSQEGAEAFAKRLRTLGANALVVREGGTSYLITLGPYQKPAVDAITNIVAHFETTVNVTPAR